MSMSLGELLMIVLLVVSGVLLVYLIATWKNLDSDTSGYSTAFYISGILISPIVFVICLSWFLIMIDFGGFLLKLFSLQIF